MTDVLHLFANHKITGPAELALETGDYEAIHISWAQRIHQAADQWLDANGWVHGKSAAATSEAMEL